MGKRYRFRGRPDPRNRDRHRCGAKLHGRLACCRRWPVKGKKRCRLHGGLSTGAKTPEGNARVLAALTEGRRRWIEQMKAEGKKFPWGRKAGYRWITPAMREREIRALQESVALPGRPTRSELRTMPARKATASRDRSARRVTRTVQESPEVDLPTLRLIAAASSGGYAWTTPKMREREYQAAIPHQQASMGSRSS